LKDRLLIAALSAVPKHGLSRLVGALTRAALPRPLLQAAMRAFAARYGIALHESPPLDGYRTFGQFFARPLLAGRRPVAPGEAVVVSPVDAVVSACGLSAGGRLLQAKGVDYGAGELLADAELASRLSGGAFATLYLSPRDYHRIHFPLAGQVLGWRYVPGTLWPVNPASVAQVPGLFARNERLVTVLDTALGRCAVVAVGATIVGRVRASYDPGVPVTNLAGAGPRRHDYPQPIAVEKGGELGAFEMGSTVILLFEPGRVALGPAVVSGARLRVGEPIGGPC